MCKTSITPLEAATRKTLITMRFGGAAPENRHVVTAYAYAVDRGDEKQKQFQNILRAIGFNVKLKPFISRADGSAKGDWDVGITIDMLEHAPQIRCGGAGLGRWRF